MSLGTSTDHEAFDHRDARAQELLLFEMLTGHLKQQGWFVVFEGALGHPCQKLLLIVGLYATKFQIIQYGLQVGTPGHLARAIVFKHTRVDV
jgi:hypothetical protein